MRSELNSELARGVGRMTVIRRTQKTIRLLISETGRHLMHISYGDKSPLLLLLIFLVFLLAACEDGESNSVGSGVTGDPIRGEALYKQTAIGTSSAPGCITCHSLAEGVTLVGPSHAGIGELASKVVPGLAADEYLRESIVYPDAHISEGFDAGVMYANYARDLTKQEIVDLVAFLESLK